MTAQQFHVTVNKFSQLVKPIINGELTSNLPAKSGYGLLLTLEFLPHQGYFLTVGLILAKRDKTRIPLMFYDYINKDTIKRVQLSENKSGRAGVNEKNHALMTLKMMHKAGLFSQIWLDNLIKEQLVT